MIKPINKTFYLYKPMSSIGFMIASISIMSVAYLVLIVTTIQMTRKNIQNYKNKLKNEFAEKYKEIPLVKSNKLSACWKYLCVFFLFLELNRKEGVYLIDLFVNRHSSDIRANGVKTPNKNVDKNNGKQNDVKDIIPLFKMLKKPIKTAIDVTLSTSEDMELLKKILDGVIKREFAVFKNWLKESSSCPSLKRIKTSFFYLCHKLLQHKLDIIKTMRQYAVLQFFYICDVNMKNYLKSYLQMPSNSELFSDGTMRLINQKLEDLENFENLENLDNLESLKNLKSINEIEWQVTGYQAEKEFQKMFQSNKQENPIFSVLDASFQLSQINKETNLENDESDIFQLFCNEIVSDTQLQRSNIQRGLYLNLEIDYHKKLFDKSFSAVCWLHSVRKTNPNLFDLYSALSCCHHMDKQTKELRTSLLHVCNNIDVDKNTLNTLFEHGVRQEVNEENLASVFGHVEDVLLSALMLVGYDHSYRSYYNFKERMMEGRYLMRYLLLPQNIGKYYEMHRIWNIDVNFLDDIYSTDYIDTFNSQENRKQFYNRLLKKFVERRDTVQY